MLILGALTLVVFAVMQKGGRLLTTSPSVATAMSEAPTSFGDKVLKLAKGARVIEVRIAGDRMIVRTRQLGGQEELVVVSLANGERLGSFVVNPE